MKLLSSLLSIALLAPLTLPCAAQEKAKDTTLAIPLSSRQWINSRPISLEAMKGKGVIFYFFEEG